MSNATPYTVSYHIACHYQVTVTASSDAQACRDVFDTVSVSRAPLPGSTLMLALVDIDDCMEVRT